MPSQPSSAAFWINCGWKVSLFLYHCVIRCAGTSPLTKSAATFLNISWVSVNDKSIVISPAKLLGNLHVLKRLNGLKQSAIFRSRRSNLPSFNQLAARFRLVCFGRLFRGLTPQAEAARKDQPVGIQGSTAVQLAGTCAHGVF